MRQLILLNGMPGIGKSTIARRYAADHPGTLVCDVDVLRMLIGGWRDDFAGAGARIRPAALGLIRGYLEHAGDVVLPQLLARASELERFEQAASESGAAFVEVMLQDDADSAVSRFHNRSDGTDEWHEIVQDLVASDGGDELLRNYHRRLTDLVRLRPATRIVPSLPGDVDGTYAAVVNAIQSGQS